MKITIGGPPGSGKGTVGKKLAKILGYKYACGGDMFRKAAEKHEMTMGDFDVFMKENPGARIDNEIDGYQKKYGEENDNFIFESRLAWYFIPDSIKIKIDADEDERIKRIANDDTIDRIAYKKESFEKTKEKTRVRFKAHQEKINEIYGIEDMMAEEHYDYIIENKRDKLDETIKEILKILKKEGIDI